MKTFEIIWRRSYEVRHRIQIEARDEKSARKKFDKIAKEICCDDYQMAVYPESEPDDICIYDVPNE